MWVSISTVLLYYKNILRLNISQLRKIFTDLMLIHNITVIIFKNQ